MKMGGWKDAVNGRRRENRKGVRRRLRVDSRGCFRACGGGGVGLDVWAGAHGSMASLQ